MQTFMHAYMSSCVQTDSNASATSAWIGRPLCTATSLSRRRDLRQPRPMLDRTLDTVDDHAGEHERAVVVGAHEIARLEQFVDALQREEARLGHDDEMRRSSKGVQGEHAEAWRAVDQHDVVSGNRSGSSSASAIVHRSSTATPSSFVADACGSRSMTSTRSPRSASAAPTPTVIVVFPTPPFWLAST